MTTRDLQRRSGAALALAVAALLAGCSDSAGTADPSASAVSDEAAVTEATTTFLRAVADGSYATALSVSTSSAADFACDTMVVDGDQSGSFAAPEVGAVDVEGDTATAEVSYWSSGDREITLDLTQVDGEWRVELPEGFRLTITFDGPTIAELVVDDGCSVPVVDAAVEILAWPSLYTLRTEDPSGVFTDREDTFLFTVAGDGSTVDPVLPVVPDLALTTTSVAASELLVASMTECFDSAYTTATCPAGTEGADPPTGERFRVITGDYNILDRVWTDDGETWRYETKPGTIALTSGGTPAEVEFTMTGTLTTDDDGELVLTVDER